VSRDDSQTAARDRMARQKMEMRQLRSALHRSEESARIANEEADALSARIVELECEVSLYKGTVKQLRADLWRVRYPIFALYTDILDWIGRAVVRVCPA
jgi:chromosome segregation ATPase